MYIATYLIDIAALFYMIGMLYSSTALKSYRKKPFLTGITLTVIIILCEMGTVLSSNAVLNIRCIHIMCNVLGFALTPMIPLAIVLIFDRRLFSTYKLLLIPTFINIAAAVISPLYRLIFYVDKNNQYARGDYFFIFIAVYIINLMLLVISTLIAGKMYNYPIMRKMAALSVFIIVGTSIQLTIPSAYSSWHCVTLSLLLYLLLMSEFDSSFDTLTGLYNRAAFDKVIKQTAETKPFSVIIIDINDFKSINDTHGHVYGDSVIKSVADIIRKSFVKNYTCYRYGGDEFFIIGSETDKEKIEYHIKTLIKNLAKMRDKGNPLPTVSYGYSIFEGGEKLDINKVLKEADDQMYYFKKSINP
ncbi:MAG TPA: GGDEF domain-containing protein [Clostridiales bacterium]|nr:GGDEF domain-containing protein [Clostridiales bacterium]